MNARFLPSALLACALSLASTACTRIPGRPEIGSVALRPDQMLNFPTLYKQTARPVTAKTERMAQPSRWPIPSTWQRQWHTPVTTGDAFPEDRYTDLCLHRSLGEVKDQLQLSGEKRSSNAKEFSCELCFGHDVLLLPISLAPSDSCAWFDASQCYSKYGVTRLFFHLPAFRDRPGRLERCQFSWATLGNRPQWTYGAILVLCH